ncbi:MAG: hypothetical protein LUG55_05585 [Clostridiales bacterium]|nr:hypothetical protein [Clostridiales bacterium]
MFLVTRLQNPHSRLTLSATIITRTDRFCKNGKENFSQKGKIKGAAFWQNNEWPPLPFFKKSGYIR